MTQQQTTIKTGNIVLNTIGSNTKSDQPVVALREPNEQEIVILETIRNNINIKDTGSIIKYGTEAQQQITQFADTVLNKVKTKDVGATGKQLTEMIDEMKRIDFGSIKSNDGFLAKLPIIGYWMKRGIQNFVGDFSNVQDKVLELMNLMENQEKILIKDIEMFDSFYDQTLQFVRNLELFIMAGEDKLVELHKELEVMKARSDETKDHLDAQQYSDMFKAVDRFEKRIHNLKISRIASINSGAHIRIAQEADRMSIEDINDIVNNTIPLWKNQFVMAISLMNTEKAIQINKTVKDYTNKQYVENAKKLSSVVTQIESEYRRGILDIESLKEVNKLTIDTIQKSLNIHKEAAVKRQEAEKQLIIMEDEIKQALTDAHNKGGL